MIARYEIQNMELFRRVVNFVSKSNARIFSARSIEAYMKMRKLGGVLITTDEFDYSTSMVRHLGVKVFLEMKDLER